MMITYKASEPIIDNLGLSIADYYLYFGQHFYADQVIVLVSHRMGHDNWYWR